MSAKNDQDTAAPTTDPVSERFARIEKVGVNGGLALLLVAFTLYITGLMEPLLEPEWLLTHLDHQATVFTRLTGFPAGWTWVAHLGFSDVLSFAALVVLALVVVVGYASLLPALLRQGEFIHLTLVVLQLLVFAIVIGGWAGGGH